MQNGIALWATVHWLFDRHLISLTDDFALLVAHNRVPIALQSLFAMQMDQIILPREPSSRPRLAYIRLRLLCSRERPRRMKTFSECIIAKLNSSGDHEMPLDSTGGERKGGRQRSLNVLGGVLEPCSIGPVTGFHRDGCCSTGPDDIGSHTVCAVMNEAFLAFSRMRGNDLSTPMPDYGFPGLRPGDRWCLCAPRWQEAFEAGVAPLVMLQATEFSALDYCSLADLKRNAIGPS